MLLQLHKHNTAPDHAARSCAGIAGKNFSALKACVFSLTPGAAVSKNIIQLGNACVLSGQTPDACNTLVARSCIEGGTHSEEQCRAMWRWSPNPFAKAIIAPDTDLCQEVLDWNFVEEKSTEKLTEALPELRDSLHVLPRGRFSRLLQLNAGLSPSHGIHRSMCA